MSQLSTATVVSTKANLKWIKVNKEKMDILYDNGLHLDEIKVIARYIGSCGHDNKRHCKYCGEIYSKKKSKLDKYYHYRCHRDPVVIKQMEEENKKKAEEFKRCQELYRKSVLEAEQKQLDKEMIKMIEDAKEEDKDERILDLSNHILDLSKDMLRIKS